MKTYAAMILGCKVNDYEATCILNELDKHMERVPFNDCADVYLIFTCCVTNVAEAKTRKFIHRARRTNPQSFICAIGCLSQVKGNTDDFKDVDLIIGSSKKDEVVSLILKNIHGNMVEAKEVFDYENLAIMDYPGKSRAFLKIQDGCNQFCTYCIIPYSRGRERSLDHEIVLDYAKKLSENYREIVLTGIHTGRYFDGTYHLVDLLKMLLNETDLDTIRLSSIELNEVTDEIIELMKNSHGRIAPHLHIPVQAMSNPVLKDMHRPYTIEQFLERIQYIRSHIEGISISTDLIVGFPNESDEIFNASLKMMDAIDFSFIHVFPYSKKEGTVAANMKGHIHPDKKKERVHIIEEKEKEHTNSFISSFIGKNVQVLIESNEDGLSSGYAKQYFRVSIPGNYKIGSILNVRIVSCEKEGAIGELLS